MSDQNDIVTTVRSVMPITERFAYFDHAAVAPLPIPTWDRWQEWGKEQAELGVVNWSRWRDGIERTRKDAAKLINASTTEVAMIRNTSEGISLVAEGYPWRDGDNVVTLDSEFPSNLFPWMHLADRGVETRRVACPDERLDLNRLAEACDSHTRIISLSWVGYMTGWRNDLATIAELAHERGALLFVDAIQGLGALPLDVRETNIDFLAADGHKWMLGPEGAGILFVKEEHLNTLRPLGVGWNSVKHAGDFTKLDLRFKNSAGRYEGGTYNMGCTNAFGSSLDLLLGTGPDRIANQIWEYTESLCEQLQQIGAVIDSDRTPERKSGIIAALFPDHDPQQLKKHLLNLDVIVNTRAGRLRISPHVYNNQEDADRLIDGLKEVV